MEKLSMHISMLRAKMAYAEELYGFRINYLPLLIREDEIIILDRRDGRIRRLPGRKELTEDEIREIEDEILKNIESGEVERYLTMNMGCVRIPGE
ncbi:hypothetical protein JCM16138_02910 [Thermococcus atlanticus]